MDQPVDVRTRASCAGTGAGAGARAGAFTIVTAFPNVPTLSGAGSSDGMLIRCGARLGRSTNDGPDANGWRAEARAAASWNRFFGSFYKHREITRQSASGTY